MFIPLYIVIPTIFFTFILFGAAIIGWVAASDRLEKAQDKNKEYIEKNFELKDRLYKVEFKLYQSEIDRGFKDNE